MRTPLRVTHVIDSLGRGGAELNLLEVVSRLNRHVYSSQIISLGEPVDLLPQFEARGIPVSTLNSDPRHHPIASFWRLARALSVSKPRIIHTHLYLASQFGRLAAVFTPAQVVSTLHNPDYTAELHLAQHPRLRRWLDALSVRRANAILAVSHAVAADYRKQMGWSHIEVVHNGVDTGYFKPGTPRRVPCEVWERPGPRLLNIGRLHPQKGQLDLLEAVRLCVDREVHVRLAIVGVGPLQAELLSRTRKLCVEDHVELVAGVTDVRPFLQAADVFVFPSRYEALGVALLEAMAVGLTVIATEVDGIREVVTHLENGLLVKPGAPGDLATAVVEVWQRPELCKRLSSAARLRALDFDISRQVSRIEEVYGRLAPSPLVDAFA